MEKEKRLEKDLLGEMNLPGNALWGIHTHRAAANFTLSGVTVNARLIKTTAMVKKSACRANRELGYLTENTAAAIEQACDEIIAGNLSVFFPVDACQGGAGTSVNMNVNEVIANRALQILGKHPGDHEAIGPLKHINLHQSTNDVFPTALKIAAIFAFRELNAKIASLQGSFQLKEKEFGKILKIGRTEMQEAVPMTLGAEFGAFAEAFGRDRWRTFKCEERLRMTNIGGTAVGTGLTAPREYVFSVIDKLREITGLNLSRGENVVDQTANADCFVEVSGILKAHASNLIKTANDLRLLNLLGEIHLPPVQSGSSIMPGKVNPVIAEAVIQTGMKVAANDILIFDAVSRSSLQICEFLPVVADALLGSLDLLIKANELFSVHVAAIAADEAACLRNLNNSPSIITAFLPYIGYQRAEELIKDLNSAAGRTIREYLEEKLGKDLVGDVLTPEKLTALGFKNKVSE
jgi:aspartate ammonia-lyase